MCKTNCPRMSVNVHKQRTTKNTQRTNVLQFRHNIALNINQLQEWGSFCYPIHSDPRGNGVGFIIRFAIVLYISMCLYL